MPPLPLAGALRGRATSAPREEWIDRAVRWLPVMVFYAMLIPAGLSVEIAGLRLYAFRAALLVALPLVVYQAWRISLRPTPVDALIAASALWTIIAFVANRGFAEGLPSGGRYALDMAVSYGLARVALRNEADLAAFLKAILPGMVLCAGLLALESLTGSLRLIALFPMEGDMGSSANEYRLGLLRAFGPFSHAILGGLLTTAFLSLYLYCSGRGNHRFIGAGAALAGVFTVSSAAFANLAVQGAMMAYRRIARLFGFDRDWRPLMIGLVALVVALELVTKGGAAASIIRLTALDPATGYMRLQIWEHGVASVRANPVFGIGYQHYAEGTYLSDSIDNHWLYLAVRFGLPQLLLEGAAIIAVLYRLAAISSRLPEQPGRPFTGMFIALFCIVFAGTSVAFFNEFLVFYYLLVGIAAGLTQVYARRCERAADIRRQMAAMAASA